MKNYQNFDFKLGEIAQLLTNLTSEFKDLTKEFSEENLKEFRYAIGNSICALNDIREKIIYEKYPDLTHDFLKEDRQNHDRMEALREIQGEAIIAFREKEYKKAKEKFEELLQKAEFGHYKLVAEVGLYECKHRIKNDFSEMKTKKYQTFEKLDEIYQKGFKFENKKEFAKAKEIYENLLKISKFSEFENKAMAGLYRCEKALNLY